MKGIQHNITIIEPTISVFSTREMEIFEQQNPHEYEIS